MGYWTVRARGWVVGGGPPGVEADRVRVYVLAGVPDCGVGGIFAPQESMDRISAISRVVAMAVRGVTWLLNFCLVVVRGLAVGLWWLVCRRARISWDARRRWGGIFSGAGIMKIAVESAIDRTARRIGNVVCGNVVIGTVTIGNVVFGNVVIGGVGIESMTLDWLCEGLVLGALGANGRWDEPTR
jgi:uncharacterized membrane protein